MSQEKENYENLHWADSSAQEVLETFPNENVYTVASGITPSGIIHVGHFREIITSELVRRALVDKKKKTKFIYSWDSFDAFRKVPKNLPKEWEQYLRLHDSDVPDPWNCHESFAEHYMQEAEESLKVFGFPIEFQRQHKLQSSGIYAEGIKKSLVNREKIRKILDAHRSEPLQEDWFPLDVFSEKTKKDTTEILSYDEDFKITYRCNETGFENTIDIRKTPIVKLPWRLDWPMRWSHYQVAFEPGGKDHSTPGGSYDTGKEIVKEVFGRPAPVYTFYNFIGMKGQGGKISSSKGDGATISDVLKVYTPEMVLFLFAGTRPSSEMSVSFDVDVIKNYEDFDKLERIYYNEEEEENPKTKAHLTRVYELSQVGEVRKPQKKMPSQFSFRHLTTVAQTNDFDFAKVEEYYKAELKTDFDKKRLKERFECVKNWLEMYAPDDMKFSLNIEVSKETLQKLSKEEKALIVKVREALQSAKTPEDFNDTMKELVGSSGIPPKEVFAMFYGLLISKERGPRLANFMFENKEKFLNLLNKV